MSEIQILAECVVKLEEIKQEADDPVEESVWNSTEFVESSTLHNVVKDDREEELQPVASVFLEIKHDIKEEVEEEYEDPLGNCGEELGVAQDVKSQSPWVPGEECSTTNTSHEESLGGQSACSFNRQLYSAVGTSAAAPVNESSVEGVLNVPTRTVADENEFKCNLCSKYFKQKLYLEIHTQFNHKGKPYRCPLCLECFMQIRCFVGHMRSAHRTRVDKDSHTGERTFFCHMCTRTFRQKRHLDMHMQAHNSERLHYCSVCQMSFKRKNQIVYHRRMHSGEKPFPCTVCSNRFRTNSHLVNHMRTHTGEKPHQCSVCGKRFSLPGNLVTHMRTH